MRPAHKQAGAWRREDPATGRAIAFPGNVSETLQRAFFGGWMEGGRQAVGFQLDGKAYEADFRTMRV